MAHGGLFGRELSVRTSPVNITCEIVADGSLKVDVLNFTVFSTNSACSCSQSWSREGKLYHSSSIPSTLRAFEMRLEVPKAKGHPIYYLNESMATSIMATFPRKRQSWIECFPMFFENIAMSDNISDYSSFHATIYGPCCKRCESGNNKCCTAMRRTSYYLTHHMSARGTTMLYHEIRQHMLAYQVHQSPPPRSVLDHMFCEVFLETCNIEDCGRHVPCSTKTSSFVDLQEAFSTMLYQVQNQT